MQPNKLVLPDMVLLKLAMSRTTKAITLVICESGVEQGESEHENVVFGIQLPVTNGSNLDPQKSLLSTNLSGHHSLFSVHVLFPQVFFGVRSRVLFATRPPNS